MDLVLLLLVLSILTSFYILYKIPIVQYYTKYIMFITIANVGSFFFSIIFVIKGEPSYENSCDVMPLVNMCKFFLGVHMKFYGLENCYAYRQCIYVLNHQSIIDALVLASLWREPSTTIVKSSLRYFGLGWLMMYFTKILPIVRNDHVKAMQTMGKAAKMLINDHANMFIFPEGTRNRNGDKLLPFKKGAFHLAVQTKLPIVPVVISSYRSFLDHKNKVFENAAYGVYILKPFTTESLTSCNVGKLTEEVHKAMSDVFELTVKATKEDLWMDLRQKNAKEQETVEDQPRSD